MIKNSKLIGTVIDEPFGWKKFSPLDIFTLENSPKENDILQMVGCVSAGEGALGVSKVIETYNYDNHLITISKLGQTFYHDNNVSWSDDVLGLVPHINNTKVGMFLASIIDKQTRAISSYGLQFRMKRLDELSLLLPVKEQGTPDYAFMESYVKELEKAHVKELENFLTVSNLSDTTLTPKEQETLDLWRAHEQSLGGGANP